ncbi:hypothetical protein C8Q80DRAFT_1154839 [Daedaleopsis nitida]|nr:hypothetical protein C8Q80DRAFT_1154839 [Daedaleopsis nitida]
MALHMSTIVSRKTTDILAHLSQLRATVSHQPLLYTISASQHSDRPDLSRLVSFVKSLSSSSVGCLSAPIPSGRPGWQEYTSVSVATFDEQHATLFRSTIPGRKAAQVGRWHALHQKDKQPDTRDYSQDIDWESALSRSYESTSLPSELQGLSRESVDSFIYFSDNASEGLSSALSNVASAKKLGLIATSTPFVTGRPYTLFHDDDIHSDGAVGVCLSSPACATHSSEFPGLEAITRPMLVTSSEGNLVNALDNANPSRLLLHAIQTHPTLNNLADQNLSKELRIYMGTLKRQGGVHTLDQLFYITSGDPSRGSIALDSDTAPPEGTLVQMFLLPPSSNPDILSGLQRNVPQRSSLTFASITLDDLNAISADAPNLQDAPETTVLHDVFLAASENGCIVSRGTPSSGKTEQPWKCVVPGGLMGLHW